MADISKIRVNGADYDISDTAARESIENIRSGLNEESNARQNADTDLGNRIDGKTSVTIAGQHVATFDADTKVDKITSGSGIRIPVTNASGNQSVLNASGAADAGTAAVRGAGGTLKVGTPSEAGDAATKGYVDGKIAACEPADSAIMKTDEDQTMTAALSLAADPTSNMHAATKRYVDAIRNSITISMDPSTYILTLKYLESGEYTTLGTVDLPLESMLLGASINGNILTLTFRVGEGEQQSVSVDLTSMITTAISNYVTLVTLEDACGTTLASAKDYTDTEVGGEATARQGADNALGLRIDGKSSVTVGGQHVATFDADTKIAKENIDTSIPNNPSDERVPSTKLLKTSVDGEAGVRDTADTALGTRIDDEASARTSADTALGTRIDTLTPVYESFTITSWSSIVGAYPYAYQTTVTSTYTIGNNTVVELINNNAILFATYGFAISAVNGQNITVLSIGEPTSSVTLEVSFVG